MTIRSGVAWTHSFTARRGSAPSSRCTLVSVCPCGPLWMGHVHTFPVTTTSTSGVHSVCGFVQEKPKRTACDGRAAWDGAGGVEVLLQASSLISSSFVWGRLASQRPGCCGWRPGGGLPARTAPLAVQTKQGSAPAGN